MTCMLQDMGCNQRPQRLHLLVHCGRSNCRRQLSRSQRRRQTQGSRMSRSMGTLCRSSELQKLTSAFWPSLTPGTSYPSSSGLAFGGDATNVRNNLVGRGFANASWSARIVPVDQAQPGLLRVEADQEGRLEETLCKQEAGDGRTRED